MHAGTILKESFHKSRFIIGWICPRSLSELYHRVSRVSKLDWTDRSHQKEIIIWINKSVWQTGNPMHIDFDSRRWKSWQVIWIGKYFFVSHNADIWMISIEPNGDLFMFSMKRFRGFHGWIIFKNGYYLRLSIDTSQFSGEIQKNLQNDAARFLKMFNLEQFNWKICCDKVYYECFFIFLLRREACVSSLSW